MTSFICCFAPILGGYYPLFYVAILRTKAGAFPPMAVWGGNLLSRRSYFPTRINTAFGTRPAPDAAALERHERLRTALGTGRTWIAVGAAAVFLQLLLGALVRHHGAALVCLGVPECTLGGEWLPATGVQQLHMLHRAFGVVVGIVTILAAIQVLRRAGGWPAVRLLAGLAPVLVLAQIGLGIATVMTMRSVPVAVGHFAGAAGLWALWVSLWLVTARRTRDVGSTFEVGTPPIGLS